jgi:hypothetical protein
MSAQPTMAEERVKRIVISLEADGTPRVPPQQQVVEINRKNNEEVIWESDHLFRVDFSEDVSPFYEDQFNNDFPQSGLARRGVLPSEERSYKYTIEVNGKTLDPAIKVYGGGK